MVLGVVLAGAGGCEEAGSGPSPTTPPAPPPANRAPQTVGSISPLTVGEGRSAAVEVAAHFTDPDGDALTYGAASSDLAVATVETTGGSLTIRAVAQGNATLTVTATDPGGLAATQEFAVTVAPLAASVFDALMTEFTEEHGIGAAALGIMKDGEIVYDQAFGWMDRERTVPIRQDVMMRLASVTKPFTAAAVQELARGGALDLDALVFDLGQPGGGLLDLAPFPSLGDARLAEITVQHLLRHRGGWDRDVAGDLTYREIEIAAVMSVPSPPGAENTVRYILGQPLQFDPGSERAYSNIGYMVLGLVIEEVSREDYLRHLFRAVLAPLGVRSDDIIQGRTFPRDRSDREPWYDDDRLVHNVFDPTGPRVRAPDGGSDREARIALGGLVAPTTTVLRLLDVYTISGDDIGTRRRRGAESPGWRRRHGGSIPGTDAVARQRGDGINYAVLFNRRRPSSEDRRYVTEIVEMIDDILDDTPIAWPQTGHTEWTGGGATHP